MVYVKSQGATKVRQAIDRGYVTNQEISATLGGLERSLGGDRRTTLHDEIAGASRYYTLMPRPGFIGRCYLAGKDIADRVASLSSVAYGVATGACYQFGAALANTSLGGVVNPKTALYELITKGKFKVSGEVGFDALLTPITAMPQVIIE